MEGRFSIIAVVVFWLITMTWLMWTKVLPPLLVGEAPDYKAIVEDHEAVPKPSAWIVSCNGKPFGVAANCLERTNQLSRIHSFVKFDRLPLEEIPFFAARVAHQFPQLSSSEVHAHSTLLIDQLGRLIDFESRLRIGEVEVLRLFGVVQSGNLHVTVSSSLVGEQKVFDWPIGSNSLLGDQLAPQDRLPGLHVGQQWSAPVYSVVRLLFQQDPIEITQAYVEREELVYIGGRKVATLLVVIRSDPGAGDQEEHGRMWVDSQGNVLRQEMNFLGAKLRFERCDEINSATIYQNIQRRWQDGMKSASKTRVMK